MKLKIWHLVREVTALTFGVLVVVFILFGYQPGDNRSFNQVDSTEQSQDDEGSENPLLVSIDWVSSVGTTNIQPVFNWIRDIVIPENPVVHVYDVLETGTTQFFQTLFQQIISPNAP